MSPDAMSDLHAWRRRHVSGVTGLVTLVPGVGSWAVSISRLKSRKQHLSEHSPLLTDAQHAVQIATRVRSWLTTVRCANNGFDSNAARGNDERRRFALPRAESTTGAARQLHTKR